jgi:hypothetical protein
MIRNFFLLVFASCFLMQCSFDGNGTKKNEQIDEGVKNTIKGLNDKLVKALVSNDVEGLKTIMSDDLQAQVAADLAKMSASLKDVFKSDKYETIDAYHTVGLKNAPNLEHASKDRENNKYTFKYKAKSKDMYVSLLLPETINNEIMVTAVYGKYSDVWKLNILRFGQYSYFKKLSPSYLKLSEESYKQGNLIDAVNHIILAKQCMEPASELFTYEKESEINAMHEQVMKDINAKYTFPITLENVPSKPQIFRLLPHITEEGCYPIIYYLSKYSVQDSTSLKVEYEGMRKEMGKMFKGIDTDKKYVYYWAFNEIPDDKKQVLHYAFVDKR